MAAVNPMLAVQDFQPFLGRIFPGVHQSYRTRQNCVRTKETAVRTDAGICAAETVDATGGLDISVQILWVDVILIPAVGVRGGFYDIRPDAVDPGISLFKIHDQVTNQWSYDQCFKSTRTRSR